jgi:hypothetical protein
VHVKELGTLKAIVARLERDSHDQLLLENESQGVFTHLVTEVAGIKRVVGALSLKVDDELASLRLECDTLRGA